LARASYRQEGRIHESRLLLGRPWCDHTGRNEEETADDVDANLPIILSFEEINANRRKATGKMEIKGEIRHKIITMMIRKILYVRVD